MWAGRVCRAALMSWAGRGGSCVEILLEQRCCVVTTLHPQTHSHNPPMQVKGSLNIFSLPMTMNSFTLRYTLKTENVCPK